MADQHSAEDSCTSEISGGSSESTVQLNVKTLDSQIHSFNVEKNMPISLFKEKIAHEIGLPVGQQRLIFRGKVLKDNHLLSDYHVENGDTLHLVARQLAQSQPSAGTSSGETNVNNGNDASASAPRNRIGQISHSVVLGTFNVGDQGEGIVPDLSRVIGAVLNSIGIGNQPINIGSGGTQSSMLSNLPGQATQGNETEGTNSGAGQNQAVNQMHSRQAFSSQQFYPIPQVMQTPLTGAAVPVPSLHLPIPDSLNTMSEFMNRMQQAMSQYADQSNSSIPARDVPTAELPSNARGLPTPEALSIVLRQAQRLLSDHAVAALSHIAGRLEQDGTSSDTGIRSQIQTESVQIGLVMQHLGALFLELGRTILTLRMGQSPAEPFVNAGPAVYISPSGPNPLMVQPFPLQTSSLFGASAVLSNPGTFGPVGVGNVPRHINIHIHAGLGARGSNGEAMQGERPNGTGSGDSGSAQVLPIRNVIAAAVPTTAGTQPDAGVPPGSVPLSTLVAEVNSEIRNYLNNMRGENQTPSGQSESSTTQDMSTGVGAGNVVVNDLLSGMSASDAGGTNLSLPGCMPERQDQKHQSGSCQVSNSKDSTGLLRSKDASNCSAEGAMSSSGQTASKSVDGSEDAAGSGEGHNMAEAPQAVPLGLGLGGLQAKRRSRQPKSQVKSSEGGTSTTNQNQNTGTSGQQVLQSLAPDSSVLNSNTTNGGHVPDVQFDPSSIMSQVIHSPALDGLLAGVSEQTGVGSPDMLRNMLNQFSQSPVMRNAMSQIAQQVDRQDIGNTFSGLGGGQGGGLDLSRMVQQMMPIVSRALGGGGLAFQESFPAVEAEPLPPYSDGRPSRDYEPRDQSSQINLQQVIERIEHQNPPGDVFRALAENAGRIYGNGDSLDDLVNELCGDEDLAGEFMEMLQRDVHRRVADS